MSTPIVLTYADYAAIPNDGRRYELHEGEISVTPAPSPQHQQIIGNLYLRLRLHVDAEGLGQVLLSPIDCIISDTTVVQPDIVYLEASRLTVISRRGVEGPPTLLVEVLSPSTLQIDRSVKGQLYAKHGVPYYWIVDAEARTVEAFELGDRGYRPAGVLQGQRPATLPPFPGLTLDPSAIWP